MGSDPQYAKWPLLPLAQQVFTLTNPYASRAAEQTAVKNLQDAISEHKMAPLYRYLAHPLEGILNVVGEGGSNIPGKPLSRKSSAVGMIATRGPTASISLPWDEALYQSLQAENDKELEEFQKEEDEAVEKAGDTEIMAAKGKRAEFWARVGDKVCREPYLHLVYRWFKLGGPDTNFSFYALRKKPLLLTKMYLRRRVFLAPRSTLSWRLFGWDCSTETSSWSRSTLSAPRHSSRVVVTGIAAIVSRPTRVCTS